MTPSRKTALVTGAASGLGKLAAQRLAAAGTTVAALDQDVDGLAATALRAPNMWTFPCDLTDADAVTTVVERITTELGPVEHVVHAAGMCRIGTALGHPPSSLRRLIEVNYLGTVHLCQAVLPGMMHRGAGSLVLFGSLSGWLPSPRLAAYSASKSAVAAYAEVLAQETSGSGVRVLCACPGQVETPLAENIRTLDPNVLGGRRGSTPESVLDAVDEALADPRSPLFLFPGKWTRNVWRARRFAPVLLRRVITRSIRPVLAGTDGAGHSDT